MRGRLNIFFAVSAPGKGAAWLNGLKNIGNPRLLTVLFINTFRLFGALDMSS
jgi:hypothetical protein